LKDKFATEPAAHRYYCKNQGNLCSRAIQNPLSFGFKFRLGVGLCQVVEKP